MTSKIKISVIILLCNLFLCSTLFGQPVKNKRIMFSDSIIEYDQHFLSLDKRYLAIIKWLGRDKPSGYRTSDIFFFEILSNQPSPVTIGSLLGYSQFWYIEKNGIAWDLNNNFYFLLKKLSGISTFYKYNIKKGEMKEMQLKLDISITNPLAISPDGGKTIFLVNKNSQKGNSDKDLCLYNLTNNYAKIIEEDVGDFSPAPVWLENDKIVYCKKNNLYLYNLLNNEAKKLTDFTNGLINYLQPWYKGSKLFFMRRNPPLETLLEETEAWLKTEEQYRGKKPLYIREFWEIDLNTHRNKMIASFETMQNGIIRDDSSIIIPLPSEKDNYHLYLAKKDRTRQLTFGDVVDDLPIIISKGKVIFRRNYKEIMMLDMRK